MSHCQNQDGGAIYLVNYDMRTVRMAAPLPRQLVVHWSTNSRIFGDKLKARIELNLITFGLRVSECFNRIGVDCPQIIACFDCKLISQSEPAALPRAGVLLRISPWASFR